MESLAASKGRGQKVLWAGQVIDMDEHVDRAHVHNHARFEEEHEHEHGHGHTPLHKFTHVHVHSHRQVGK